VTQMQVADTGLLCVSSQRVVFMGARKTIEMPYSKLATFQSLRTACKFHQSNRQTAPLFRLRGGEVVAAAVNAAVHRIA